MNPIDPNNYVCSICLQKLYDGKDISANLCGHLYHHQCIQYALHRKPNCPNCRRPTTRRELVKLIFSHDIGVPDIRVRHGAGASSTSNDHNNKNQQQQQMTSIVTASTSKSGSKQSPSITQAISSKNKRGRKNKLVVQAAVTPVAATSSSNNASVVPADPGRITARRLTRSSDLSQVDQVIRFASKICVLCANFFLASNMDVCDACRRKLES